MSSVPQKFIFINNDEVQVGPAAKKTIRRHVQREYQRKCRIARRLDFTPSLWTPPSTGSVGNARGSLPQRLHFTASNFKGDSSIDQSSQTAPFPEALAPYSKPPLERPQTEQRPPYIDSDGDRDEATLPQTWDVSLRSSSGHISPMTMLDTGHMDLISSSRVPLTKNMNYLLHHLLTITLPEYWNNRTSAENLGPLYLSLSSTQPEALFGHLATAATHLCIKYRHAQGLSESDPVRTKLEASQLAFKREAIRLFNKKLTSSRAAFDKSTFHVLMSLLVVEMMAQDETGITAHLNGFQNLVALRGGMHTLPEYTRMGLTTLSYDWAIVTRSMPLDPPKMDESIELSEEAWAILSGKKLHLGDLGQGFYQTHIFSVIDPRLYVPIGQLREAMLFREFCAVMDPSLSPLQLRHFMYESIESRHKLLQLPFLDPYFKGDIIGYRSESCRLALLFSGIVQRYLDPSSIIYHSLACQLASVLESSDLPSLWGSAVDLLAWILFISAHLSQGTEAELFFHVHLARCGQRLGWKEWADCRRLLMNFFYTDRLHKHSFQSIWAEVRKIMNLLN